MKLSEEVLAIVADSTPATLEQWNKALQAVESGAAVGYRYGQDFKVAIPSSSNPKVIYRFGINEPCSCIASQHNNNCWHRCAADMLYVQSELNERENAAKRAAAKLQARQPVAAAVSCGSNAMNALFPLNLPSND